jgi:methylase of polypeptide subunit release factors
MLEKPEHINPELTQKFIESINLNKEVYRVDVTVDNKVIPIDVFPEVFPPKSDYSISSKSVFETFGDLDNLIIADIGSGTGIESIVAAMYGAEHVDASDINEQAVACTKHNIEINGLSEKINVFHSDLFSNFPKKEYDFIIANLPIVNFDAGNSLVHKALYDKDFAVHKRLFEEAKDFLSSNGVIVFTHANLQSSNTENPGYDFEVMENLIKEHGYLVIEKDVQYNIGHTWINYKIKLK